MVGDLEDPRRQAPGEAQQIALGGPLDIAREQHVTAPPRGPQDERGVVHLAVAAGVGTSRRGREDLEHEPGEGRALAGHGAVDRNPAPGGRQHPRDGG